MLERQEPKDWMEGVKAPVILSEMKGVVKKIFEPREIKTIYGQRKMIQLIVEGKEGQVIATEYLPGAYPVISLNTNIGLILVKYGCKNLKELIGKEVTLVKGKQNFIKISKEPVIAQPGPK